MRSVLLFLLLPIITYAQQQQEVLPIISSDYSKLINQNKKDSTPKQTINNFGNATITNKYNVYSLTQPLKSIHINGGILKIKNQYTKTIQFSISYSSSASINNANRKPKLQNTYAQGETNNGTIVWRGAEQNVPFSYGPAIGNLYYDGSNYAYDNKGKLVHNSDGGQQAKPYNNSVLKRGSSINQSINAQAKISKQYNNYWELGILYNTNNECLIIADNKNTNNNVLVSVNKKINTTSYKLSYYTTQTNFFNANYNGFLNKVYLNSLITPICFNNKYNNKYTTPQQSFNTNTDNPYFLLNNNNSNQHNVNTVSTAAETTKGRLTIKIASSYEKELENTIELSKASSSFFNNGYNYNRSKINTRANTSLNATYNWGSSYRLKQNVVLVTNTQYANSTIAYNGTVQSNYKYNRVNNTTSVTHFLNAQTNNNQEYGSKVGNQIYVSNTASKNSLLLPSISMYYIKRAKQYKYIKLIVQANTTCSELPINNSMATINLMQLLPQQLNAYMPSTEIASFKNLKTIKQNELNGTLELGYKNRLTINTELYLKKINNDIFPIINNNILQLKNIANHTTKGIEIEVQYKNAYKKDKINIKSAISFNKFITTVNEVMSGYNNIPIAGFANVNKAIIQGQQLGVIVGNSYAKNANGKNIIDASGYPVVNNNVKVIGNATPKFVLKQSNTLSYKNWNFNLDYEWKNGGQIWNGTQAVLDYYGMSVTTAQQRNIVNYVYDGVTINGDKNTKAISFYDNNQPTTQNKWTRYGYTGVAENYIHNASQIKIHNIGFVYAKTCKKYIQQYSIGMYAHNIIVWSGYNGIDTDQVMLNQANSQGLDFFNIPATRSIGITLHVKY
jgi:hypothetical protein